MEKMKEAAKIKELEVNILAVPESSFDLETIPTDILLLGPQVGHLLNEFKSKYEPEGIKVELINMVDYGMMNGNKVLEDALALTNNKKGE